MLRHARGDSTRHASREFAVGIPRVAAQAGVMRFVHDTFAQRVLFATGEAAENLKAATEQLRVGNLMVIAAEAEQELAQRITGGLPVAVHYDEVSMHVPVEVAGRARAVASDRAVDALISVGGGAATGLAKAIALTSGLPIVAVPTTYAGSEATSVWGLTEGSRKTTGVETRVLPRVIVYDASLTMSLPVDISVASGLNALAHCVDAMWSPGSNPINRTLAAEGICALSDALPKVVSHPTGVDGREQALYAAYLSGLAFASAGSGLHHKVCHVLGGRYNLPHAQTHAVVLPYVLALNATSAPHAERRIAAALGSDRATSGLAQLRELLHAPRALRDYGFDEREVGPAAEAIMDVVPASNPKRVTIDDLRLLLRAAWEGADPRAIPIEE